MSSFTNHSIDYKDLTLNISIHNFKANQLFNNDLGLKQYIDYIFAGYIFAGLNNIRKIIKNILKV